MFFVSRHVELMFFNVFLGETSRQTSCYRIIPPAVSVHAPSTYHTVLQKWPGRVPSRKGWSDHEKKGLVSQPSSALTQSLSGEHGSNHIQEASPGQSCSVCFFGDAEFLRTEKHFFVFLEAIVDQGNTVGHWFPLNLS